MKKSVWLIALVVAALGVNATFAQDKPVTKTTTTVKKTAPVTKTTKSTKSSTSAKVKQVENAG